MKCKICQSRRPRRECPGVRGDICAVCCGTEREVTVNCPLDCAYLADARLHEKALEIDPEQVPNKDVRISESFLRDHSELLAVAGSALFQVSADTPGTADGDVAEALDALVRTYRTMDSGLIYETRPSNLMAAAIQQRVREQIGQYQQQRRERLGMETLRDADVLGVLVFFQRLLFTNNNGRKRGRAFLDLLRKNFATGPAAGAAGGNLPLVTG